MTTRTKFWGEKNGLDSWVLCLTAPKPLRDVAVAFENDDFYVCAFNEEEEKGEEVFVM